MSDQNITIPTPESFGLGDTQATAYIRAVFVADLEPEVEAPEGVDVLYALHDPNGTRLALFDDRELAFAVARSNEIPAVSVH